MASGLCFGRRVPPSSKDLLQPLTPLSLRLLLIRLDGVGLIAKAMGVELAKGKILEGVDFSLTIPGWPLTANDRRLGEPGGFCAP